MPHVNVADTALETYCARVAAAGLDAPWSRPGPLIPSKKTKVEAVHWKWDDISPLLRQSAEFVKPGPEAERRILRLANPGVPEKTSAHTLSGAVQYLMPGETAPSHRHTPNAIRFMIEGQGAYTIVGETKCVMSPGDLVLTPSMSWHEHGNEGTGPVIWFDGLDSPVVRYLELMGMQPREAESAPSHAIAAAATQPSSSPRIHYRWQDTFPVLEEMAKREPDPFDDVLVEYRDPVSRKSVTPTLGCYMQMLRPGIRTRAHLQTSSAVYFVFRGRGATAVEDATFEWRAGDFFVIPPLAAHSHANDGTEPAFLFSLQDVPLVSALGMYYATAAQE
jgi:gentisate 1,2-dioxygenase